MWERMKGVGVSSELCCCADEMWCNGQNKEFVANNRSTIALGHVKARRYLLQGMQCDPLVEDLYRLRHLQLLNSQL